MWHSTEWVQYDVDYRMIWCDVMWYSIWYDIRVGAIWCRLSCEMPWCYVIYDMIWCDVMCYSIWYDIRIHIILHDIYVIYHIIWYVHVMYTHLVAWMIHASIIHDIYIRTNIKISRLLSLHHITQTNKRNTLSVLFYMILVYITLHTLCD